MSGRTRDWLKFGGLVAVAFILGLAFASALNLPRAGRAAELVQAPPAQVTRPGQTPIPAARPAAELGAAFTAVAEHVKPAVVFIRSERRERAGARRLPPGFEDFFPRRPDVQQGSGTGFIVSPDGYILTNNHVVEGSTRVEVRLYDKRVFSARVVGSDANTDVAVIKIEATRLPTADFGNSDSTRIGEWVLAIGNPLEFYFTVTAGIVSAKGRTLPRLRGDNNYTIQDFIQTDAAINPGNSGGPLVDVGGRVIGINSAIASETGFYAGYGFAIPINLARAVMTQLIETGRVRRAVMGVSIRDAEAEDAAVVGLSEIRGVVVQDYVGDDSPARAAGIKPGDVIIALDGQPVEAVPQLQQSVGFKRPGETVQVTVLRRGGERHTYGVRLVEPPADPDRPVASTGTSPKGGEAAPKEEVLGIRIEPLSQEDARAPALIAVLRAGGGLVVTDVSPDGAAYERLVPEDIILAVDDKPSRTLAEFRAAVRAAKAGDIVTLQVFNPRLGTKRIVRLRIP